MQVNLDDETIERLRLVADAKDIPLSEAAKLVVKWGVNRWNALRRYEGQPAPKTKMGRPTTKKARKKRAKKRARKTSPGSK